ncbi:MAG: dynamin family protein [Muribaculaceae bacterium]|nr:dynamin family protein [Muribaculaceae bacterium]
MRKSDEEVWKTLENVLDIRGHLDFAEGLADNPAVAAEVRDAALHRIRAIREKQQDSSINLCVVGGAGSSKSAFINALAGLEIFTSSTIADSAVVPVVVEYLSSPAIFIQDNTGRYTLEEPSGIDALRKRLTEIATDESRIGSISMIRVGIPAPALKDGLRIIDTPAHSSAEAWERPVTRELVRNQADLCVILTPAIQAMSQDSLEFLDTLPPLLVRNAMAVATHIEHVGEREVEDIRRFVAKKLRDRFDVEVPVMAVASSLRAGATGDMTGERMMHLTGSAIAEIHDRARRGRHLIQARRMVRLLNSLFETLSETVSRWRLLLEEDLKRLASVRKIPLDPVVAQARQEHLSELNALSIMARRSYTGYLDRAAEKNVTLLTQAVDSPQIRTTTALKSFLNEGFGKQCNAMAEEMKGIIPRFREDMRLAVTSALKATHRKIQQQFQNVDILDFKFSTASYDFEMETPEASTGTVGFIDNINKLDDRLGNGLMGGAVAGAVVGQLVIPVPVVGAVVGGIIGIFGGGGLFDVNVDKLKRQILYDMTPKLKAYFRELNENIRQQLEQVSANAAEGLARGVDDYLHVYKEGIDREIRSLDDRRGKLQGQIAEIDNLLRAITARKNKIEHAALKI